MSTNFYIELFFAIIMMGMFLWITYSVNHDPIGFTFPDLGAMIVCLSAGGGTMLGLFFDLRIGENPVYILTSPGLHFQTLLSVLLYVLGLRFYRKFYYSRRLGRRPTTQRNSAFSILRQIDQVPPWVVPLLIILVWSPRFMKIAMGGGVSGFGGSHIGLNMPYLLVVIQFLFSPASYGVIMYGIHRAFYSQQRNLLFMFPVIIECLFLTLQGRRQLIFAFFAMFFVALACNRRIRLFRFMVFGAFAGLFLVNFSYVFLDLRHSAKKVSSTSSRQVSAVEAVKEAIAARAGDAESQKEAVQKSYENLQIRPRMPLIWISQILEQQKLYPPMFGESTFSAAMGALPRALRPVKYWWDHASFVQRHYRLPMMDVGDNMVAVGVSDFGFVGAFLFGVLISFLFCTFGEYANQIFYKSPAIAIGVYCMCFVMAINFEASGVQPFVMLRNFGVLFVLNLLTKEFFSSVRFTNPRAHQMMQGKSLGHGTLP